MTATSGGKLMLVMADVAGKSVPAALLMATLQASLRTLASEGIPLTPARRTFESLRLRPQPGWPPLHHRGDCANTIPPRADSSMSMRATILPIVRRTNGGIERLESGGLPFGITPEATFPTASVDLAARRHSRSLHRRRRRSIQFRGRGIFRRALGSM